MMTLPVASRTSASRASLMFSMRRLGPREWIFSPTIRMAPSWMIPSCESWLPRRGARPRRESNWRAPRISRGFGRAADGTVPETSVRSLTVAALCCCSVVSTTNQPRALREALGILVAGVGMPQHANAGIAGEHALEPLGTLGGAVGHGYLPGVQRVADAHAAAVVY